MNVPKYRAKKIDSDGWVIGMLMNIGDNYFISTSTPSPVLKYGGDYHLDIKVEKIDPATLAIHFPDMLDSKKTKIFASLSEDGKGGDLFNDHTYGNKDGYMYKLRLKYGYGMIQIQKEIYDYKSYILYGGEKHIMDSLKVTGIQK